MIGALSTPALAQDRYAPPPMGDAGERSGDIAQAGPADGPPAPEQAKPARPALPPLGSPAGVYGQGVKIEESIPLARAAADVQRLHGMPVRVEARIDDVCRKKGCWMVLRDGETDVRVRFLDYGFLVPRDASGRRALVQGIITEKELTEAQARHQAEEGGDPESAKRIEGPQKVLAFTATGVEILGSERVPPTATGTAEAREQLRARLAKGTKVGAAVAVGGPVADLAAALAALRRTPGARTTEFALATEEDGWLVFGAGAPDDGGVFARGYAVAKDSGAIHRFGQD